MFEAGEPDEIDRPLGNTSAFIPREAVQLGEQLDVAADGPPRHQGGILEHVADPLAVDSHRSAGRLEQPGRNAQQRRLAAARRADDRHEFATVDAERDVGDRFVPSGNVIPMWSNDSPAAAPVGARSGAAEDVVTQVECTQGSSG